MEKAHLQSNGQTVAKLLCLVFNWSCHHFWHMSKMGEEWLVVKCLQNHYKNV